MKGISSWVLALAAVFLFSACSARPSEQLETDLDPTWAGSTAQLALSQQMDTPLEEVEIIKFEQAVWPDTCLGISQDGEICLKGKLPGYSMEFTVSNQRCQVRSNSDGSILRIRCIMNTCFGDCSPEDKMQ